MKNAIYAVGNTIEYCICTGVLRSVSQCGVAVLSKYATDDSDPAGSGAGCAYSGLRFFLKMPEFQTSGPASPEITYENILGQEVNLLLLRNQNGRLIESNPLQVHIPALQ